MTKLPAGTLSKVPEVTLGFWVIKVLATTLGETGGDAVTMSIMAPKGSPDTELIQEEPK
jgi:uncharacterized membrane-anchored protein